MMRSVLFFLLSVLLKPANAVGFQSGNSFWGYAIFGEVNLRCQDSISVETVQYKCEDTHLKPATMDYFTGPQGVKANQIELRVIQENKNIRVKKMGYNSVLAMSDSRFNLWANSLLQKPLLDFGVNEIEYRLYNNNSVVYSGRFSIDVKYGGGLVCPKQSYQSGNMNDCRQPFSFCQKYFADKNYCSN